MKRMMILAAFLPVLLPPPVGADQGDGYSLSEIVQLAIENNPRLKAMASEVEAHRAASQASKRLFNPSLSFQTGSAESHDGTKTRNTSGLSLSQYIENPLKRLNRIRMSESEWQASQYALDSLTLDVVFEVKRHFYLILLYEEREELARMNLTALEQAHELVETRVRLGETRELEAIRLQVEVMQARNELNGARTELELARRHLNGLLGAVLPGDYTLAESLTWTPVEAEESDLRELALQKHPLIGQSREDLDLARYRLGYARSSRIPDPELTGFMVDELHGRNRGIGISLAVPLWNFSSREIAEARSLSAMQEHELEALEIDISTQVAIYLNRLTLLTERIELFQTGLLRQAEESLQISETSYRQGEISLIEYLDAQRTYYSILNSYNGSLFDWNLGRAALERAIGEDLE